MRPKSETFDKFREYKAEAEKQLGVHIKQLRSDRGSEYLSGEFKFYLTQEGIVLLNSRGDSFTTVSPWNTSAKWSCRKEK